MHTGADFVIIGALLFLYLVRDSESLRLGVTRLPVQRVFAYAVVMLSTTAAGSVLADSLDLESFLVQIRQWRVAAPLLAVHMGILIRYMWLRRTATPERMWTIVLIPSPVLVLSLIGITIVLSHHVWLALTAILVSCMWVTLVVVWATWNMRAAGADDPEWGLAFIGITNLWAVLLVPAASVTRFIDNLGDVIRVILAYD